MATDLQASLIAELAAPLDAWVRAQGAEPQAALAPPTREGSDLALACHRYARVFRKAPQAIATDLAAVAAELPLVAKAEATAGFLNLHLDWPAVAHKVLDWAMTDDGALGKGDALAGQKVVIEYSSPNTNKPQHLGHCRNNILGQTVGTLLATVGADVTRVNLINDRGIHICKSMWAYQRFGAGTTPETSGVKGDHLVGRFYVQFNDAFTAEYKAATAGMDDAPDQNAWFNGDSTIGAEVRAMLLAWEANDPAVRALWAQMNGWCEAGFNATYARMGVHFDRIYKESNTYLLGKDLVASGLERGVFHHADNGAVVFDLEKIGLEGEKAVLRADGTSVYVTQDLGTATQRHADLGFDQMIYVVGNEQDHHFTVLFGILSALDESLKGRLHHLSYGMVELTTGRMKSREGTVVDADDLMNELRDAAAEQIREKWPELDEAELNRRAEAIGLSGLKFFLLKYNPQTTFVFDPKESIKAEGETGVYCQYAYARAGRILTKLDGADAGNTPDWAALDQPQARAVLTAMLQYPGEIRMAAEAHKPSAATKAVFNLAKTFATFYNHPPNNVLKAEPGAQAALAAVVRAAQRMLGGGLALLGITPLEEM
jgi:arginyl-tRNA synthetase